MGNILLVAVGVFSIIMILTGLKKGLIRMAFSLLSMIVILFLINILTPSVKQLLKATPVYTEITSSIGKYVDDNVNLATKNMTQTGVSAQQKIIDGLPLPKEIRKSLKQNNTEESYNSFKVDSFSFKNLLYFNNSKPNISLLKSF